MVKMNGFAAIDSVRPFRSWADKAAVADDFHLRKWRLLLLGMMNSKHSRCTYTLRFHTWQAGHGGTHFAYLPICSEHTWQAMHVWTHSCFLQISAVLPFAKTCWETSQTLQRFFQNRLRSCGAEHHFILESDVRIFRIPS